MIVQFLYKSPCFLQPCASSEAAQYCVYTGTEYFRKNDNKIGRTTTKFQTMHISSSNRCMETWVVTVSGKSRHTIVLGVNNSDALRKLHDTAFWISYGGRENNHMETIEIQKNGIKYVL